MDTRKDKPIEFFVVAKNPETGDETWFRTAHLQGFSEAKLANAFATGKPLEGFVWRKVPVRYRIVTEYGQAFDARWDAGKKAFVTRDGLLVGRKWCREIEEIIDDGDI